MSSYKVPDTQAHVRFQVTLEVTVSSWGGDCTLDQIYNQARQSAVNAVQAAFDPKKTGSIKLLSAMAGDVVIKVREQ